MVARAPWLGVSNRGRQSEVQGECGKATEEDKLTFSSGAHTIAETEREERPAVLPRGAAPCLVAGSGSALPNSLYVCECLPAVCICKCECLVPVGPHPL